MRARVLAIWVPLCIDDPQGTSNASVFIVVPAKAGTHSSPPDFQATYGKHMR